MAIPPARAGERPPPGRAFSHATHRDALPWAGASPCSSTTAGRGTVTTRHKRRLGISAPLPTCSSYSSARLSSSAVATALPSASTSTYTRTSTVWSAIVVPSAGGGCPAPALPAAPPVARRATSVGRPHSPSQEGSASKGSPARAGGGILNQTVGGLKGE